MYKNERERERRVRWNKFYCENINWYHHVRRNHKGKGYEQRDLSFHKLLFPWLQLWEQKHYSPVVHFEDNRKIEDNRKKLYIFLYESELFRRKINGRCPLDVFENKK